MSVPQNHVRKAAQNQALIRQVNERIEEVAGEAWRPEFLCECGDSECIETLELSIGEYEAIRCSSLRFPIKPGHEFLQFERVVEETDRHVIVEKFGEAAEVVRELDPRRTSERS
jgi:hypothetical protein